MFKIQNIVQSILLPLQLMETTKTQSKAASLIPSTESFENDGYEAIKDFAEVGKCWATLSE